MGALWDMLTCRQIHRFLEHVRTRLSKCNHPGQKTFLMSLHLSFFFFFKSPCFQLCSLVERAALLGRYLQSCCTPEELSTLTWIVEKSLTGWMTVSLLLPSLTFTLVNTSSQLTLDTQFLGCIQGRDLLALFCFSTMKSSEQFYLNAVS